MLQSMGSQRVRPDWATELKWKISLGYGRPSGWVPPMYAPALYVHNTANSPTLFHKYCPADIDILSVLSQMSLWGLWGRWCSLLYRCGQWDAQRVRGRARIEVPLQGWFHDCRCKTSVEGQQNPSMSIDSQWEFAVWLRKLKQGLCIYLEGWGGEGDEREVQKGGDISPLFCIPMADLCWGLTENSKILQSNYLSIKNKLIKKNPFVSVYHWVHTTQRTGSDQTLIPKETCTLCS